MKSKIVILLFAAILCGLSSCGNKSSKKQDAHTHTHSDGTVHEGDDCKESAPAKQESFTVTADSTSKTDTIKHNHDHHDHDHDHHH